MSSSILNHAPFLAFYYRLVPHHHLRIVLMRLELGVVTLHHRLNLSQSWYVPRPISKGAWSYTRHRLFVVLSTLSVCHLRRTCRYVVFGIFNSLPVTLNDFSCKAILSVLQIITGDVRWWRPTLLVRLLDGSLLSHELLQHLTHWKLLRSSSLRVRDPGGCGAYRSANCIRRACNKLVTKVSQ